jgi:hypothetical protein
MTDERMKLELIYKVLLMHGGVSVTGKDKALFEAGYRAGLKAAKNNYDDLSAEDWVYKSAWELHGEWLTQQVKKEQP